MGTNFLYLPTVDEIVKIEEQKNDHTDQTEDVHVDVG
jgi:hypothetical protein